MAAMQARKTGAVLGLLFAALPASSAETDIEPASIEEVVVPYLTSQVASTDTDRAWNAVVDLAYLGTTAKGAISAIEKNAEALGGKDDEDVVNVIRRLKGEKPLSEPEPVMTVMPPVPRGRWHQAFGRLSHLPILDERVPDPRIELPLAADLFLSIAPPKVPPRVGETAALEFELRTTSQHKYEIEGLPLIILSAERFDADGSRHPVDVPVETLSRRSYARGMTWDGPSSLEPSTPCRKRKVLNGDYILDHPGRYRFETEAVASLRISSSPNAPAGGRPSVRTKHVAVELEILPRRDGNSQEADLSDLLDYGAIPALLHAAEIGGNGAVTANALFGLARLCDKKRLRAEILKDIKANHRPHSTEEAETLASALAGAETIPCRPERFRKNVDYVRWDVARMQWEDRLKAKLSSAR